LVEAFDSRYDPYLAFLIFVAGISITLINLTMLFRVFSYRRISVPERVQQDAIGPAEASGSATIS
jgi:hypothetical protein